MNITSILYILVCISIGVTALKEFSLARYSDIAVYPNNSVLSIHLVGEGFEGVQITDGGALECHTDDTTCCRGIDNPPNGVGKGEWYYPDGTVVPPAKNGTSIYRTRGHMVIRLNRRPGVTSPTGTYTCVIPGAGGVNITRYITLQNSKRRCNDLYSINDGSIRYVPPRHVSADLPTGKRYVGTIATCPSGYQLVGGSVRACVEGGVWNGTATCALLCSTNLITNGRETIWRNIATYSCDRGYNLIGPSSRVCGNDGTWNTTSPPHCQIVNCGALTDPANGRVNTPSGTTFGNTASYSCDTGYTLNGVNTRTCGSDGRWSTISPTCNTSIDCGPPPNITNRQVNTSLGTFFESTAIYTCNNGYTLSDTPAQICGIDGNWTSTPPVCQCTSSLSEATRSTTIVSRDCTTTVTCECPVSTSGSQDQAINEEISSTTLIIGSSIGFLFLVSIIVNVIQAVYIVHQKKQLNTKCAIKSKQKCINQEVSTKAEGSEYEVIRERVGGMYEEVDKLREPHPPKGEYELSQCAAYGHVNIN